jgi:hypothetical protein
MGPDQVGQILNFPTSARHSEDPAPVGHAARDAASPPATDLLAEVDHIFAVRSQAMADSRQQQSQVDSAEIRLHEEFQSVCTDTVRPAMQAFLERLRANGGGGFLEERSGVPGAGVAPRIRLWMSLSGDLIGRPRRDQHPYLQLDFDVAQRRVSLIEGDVRRGHGSADPVSTWITADITDAMVTESLLEVLRRAAS